jgi:hypothetical protein
MENKKDHVNLLIRDIDTQFWKTSNGKARCKVEVPWLSDKGEFDTLTIDVPANHVKPARRGFKDENGNFIKNEDGKAKTEPIPGYSNVYLGHNNSNVIVRLGHGLTDKIEAGDVKKHYDDAKKAAKRAIAAEKALSDVSENIELSSDESYQA